MASEVAPQGARHISHSEADAFNQCEMKHYFAHREKLEPVTQSKNLAIGNAGHKYLETFLQAIKDGKSQGEAEEQALRAAMLMPFGGDAIKLALPWAQSIWPTLGWKIVAVEYEFEPLKVGPDLFFPGKVDLIAEVFNQRTREWEMLVVDHKFLYDLYTPQVTDILPQLPKYMGALKFRKFPIKGIMYNFLRTRVVKDPTTMYEQRIIYPTAERIKTSMSEQIETMKVIQSNPKPVRTSNKMNCGNCGFNELCAKRLNGEDTRLFEKVHFQPNTYGYKAKEIEE